MNVNYYNPYANSELMHYGIAGQKWGQRNGPPYPLSSSSMSSSERKMNTPKSDSNKSSNTSDKKGLSSDTKKKIAIGAAIVAGGTVAAVGGYHLYKSGALDGAISAGKAALSKAGAMKDKLPKSKEHKIRDEVKNITDVKDLNDRIEVLKKQNELATLMGSANKVNGPSKGKILMSNVYDGIAAKVIVPIGIGVVSYHLKQYADEKIGEEARQEIFRNVNAKKK